MYHKDYSFKWIHKKHIDGLVQDCGNSIANGLNAPELPQSCAKPSM